MYQPAAFRQPDVQALHALMREHPLATLVRVQADGTPAADAVPLLLDPQSGPHGTLRGHVARANPLWKEADGKPVLAIFQGPDAYVSPSWYASKREHGQVVPTWNYAVVQAHGRLRAIEDPAWLRGFLEVLTARHESHRAAPWQVGDAPEAFIQQLLGAIVGIEIELTVLEGKWKMSQNRPASDREGVVQGLREEGSASSTAVAQGVEQASSGKA